MLASWQFFLLNSQTDLVQHVVLYLEVASFICKDSDFFAC